MDHMRYYLCKMALMTRNNDISERSPLACGRIVDLQQLTKPAGSAARDMRMFGCYAAVLVIDGGGFYSDARGVECEITTGDLIHVFPELPHRYGPRQASGWAEQYLVYEGDIFDQWRRAGWLSVHNPVWHVSPVKHWARSMMRIWQPGLDAAAGVGRLLAWLGEARSEQFLADQIAPEREAWINEAREFLERDLEKSLDVREVARRVGIPYETFRRRFTKVVGVPPVRYRALRSIDQARTLMQTTAMSDKQIAAALGYCDEFYFSRRFKEIVGASPRNYRLTLGD